MTAPYVLIYTLFSLISVASEATAQSRDAQCLLEVKGSHYMGGRCKYVALDKFGSFRIIDGQGSGLIAQVNSYKKGEGHVFWNGPHGGRVISRVGQAQQQGACWIINDSRPDKYEDSRICAWRLVEKVYLGDSGGNSVAPIIYFGPRVGMFAEIASQLGLNSDNARIIVKPSRAGASIFCREYRNDYSTACFNENFNKSLDSIHGNCVEKTFTGFNGKRYMFLGKSPKTDESLEADFSIKDLATGEILDNTTASGYDVALGIYQALCPKTAPDTK